MIALSGNYLVTGGGSGLGYDLVKSLLQDGANVINIDICPKPECLEKYTNKLHWITLDLLEYNSLKEEFKDYVSKTKSIDGFVHCAGIPSIVPLKLLTPANFIKVLSINTISGILILRDLVSSKSLINDGSAVFVSSVYAQRGSAPNSIYAASKGAINSAVRSLAVELAPKKIRVNAVSPGFLNTKMLTEVSSTMGDGYIDKINSLHPLGIGETENVVSAIKYLLSSNASWITGEIMNVDGGFSAS